MKNEQNIKNKELKNHSGLSHYVLMMKLNPRRLIGRPWPSILDVTHYTKNVYEIKNVDTVRMERKGSIVLYKYICHGRTEKWWNELVKYIKVDGHASFVNVTIMQYYVRPVRFVGLDHLCHEQCLQFDHATLRRTYLLIFTSIRPYIWCSNPNNSVLFYFQYAMLGVFGHDGLNYFFFG